VTQRANRSLVAAMLATTSKLVSIASGSLMADFVRERKEVLRKQKGVLHGICVTKINFAYLWSDFFSPFAKNKNYIEFQIEYLL
jgi:hypothetical protein